MKEEPSFEKVSPVEETTSRKKGISNEPQKQKKMSPTNSKQIENREERELELVELDDEELEEIAQKRKNKQKKFQKKVKGNATQNDPYIITISDSEDFENVEPEIEQSNLMDQRKEHINGLSKHNNDEDEEKEIDILTQDENSASEINSEIEKETEHDVEIENQIEEPKVKLTQNNVQKARNIKKEKRKSKKVRNDTQNAQGKKEDKEEQDKSLKKTKKRKTRKQKQHKQDKY